MILDIIMLSMAFFSFVISIPLIYARKGIKWIFFHATLCLMDSCLVAYWVRDLMANF